MLFGHSQFWFSLLWNLEMDIALTLFLIFLPLFLIWFMICGVYDRMKSADLLHDEEFGSTRGDTFVYLKLANSRDTLLCGMIEFSKISVSLLSVTKMIKTLKFHNWKRWKFHSLLQNSQLSSKIWWPGLIHNKQMDLFIILLLILCPLFLVGYVMWGLPQKLHNFERDREAARRGKTN